jgi:glycosyltransferase involved in cell wall biosynthesis
MASTIRDGMGCECRSRPKVSICIPSYNNGSLIGTAIRSVLDQTFKDIEIIVVDNDSVDDSERVVRSYIDERIKFSKNSKNIGMTRNWNKCISMASGEFICLLCADDMYLPTFVERTLSMLEAHPNLGFVYCAYRKINDRGETIGECRMQMNDTTESGFAFFERLIHGNFVTISGVMVGRNRFEELGCFDEELAYAPDWEMLARMSLHYDVGYVSEPLACYRFHESNFTKTIKKSNRLIHEGFKTIDRIASDRAGAHFLHSKPFDPSILKSEYVMRVMGVRLDCSNSRELRRSIVEEVAKNRRGVIDLRLIIPFIVSYLGIRTALAFAYPSKLANSMLVRVLNKVDRLV